jgi:2-polyprenyl-3-methyl-5-hydroxy-6-metoxy-1,4-benzoquinol methylase
MRPIYIKDFEKFLKHTDEKQILLKRISAEIKRNNIKKLLDIGAGNGLLAIPLSRQVFEYTAIEPKKDYINILKKYGLKVIERKFPDNKIVDIYDGILISHVISYENDNYKKFIASAWKLLKPGGFLFIITHKGEKNEWTKLLEKIDLCEIIYSQNSFEKMKILLKSLGNFKFKKIISHVNADNVNDLEIGRAHV